MHGIHTQSNKRLLEISWTEAEHCYAVVQARNKKEVLELFLRGDNLVWDNVRFGHREPTGRPRGRKVRA